MAQKHLNLSRSTLFTALLLAGLIILLIPQQHTRFFNSGFRTIFNRVLKVGREAKPAPIILFGQDKDTVSLKEYNKLYATYKNTHSMLLEMQKKCEKLEKIRSGLPKWGAALVQAEVANSFLTAMERELVISPSSSTGYLQPGQYVMADNCIIGTISGISLLTARVRLVSDIKQSMAVEIAREGSDKKIPALMTGRGDGMGRISNLSQKEYDIRAGDMVYARPQKGLLETAVIIGSVSNANADEQHPLLWDVTVKPLFLPEVIEEVSVIVVNPKETVPPDKGKG